MGQSIVVAARERARIARTTRFADEMARQQLVEDRVTDFYVASEALRAAENAAASASAEMAAAVVELISVLREPVTGVAQLCGLGEAQVRSMLRTARNENDADTGGDCNTDGASDAAAATP